MSFLNSAIASSSGKGFYTLFSAGCFYKAGKTAYQYYKENSENESSLFQRTFTIYAGPYSNKEAKNKRLISEIFFWTGIGIINGLTAAVATNDCASSDEEDIYRNSFDSSLSNFDNEIPNAGHEIRVTESSSTPEFVTFFIEVGSEIENVMEKIFSLVPYSPLPNWNFSSQTPKQSLLVRPEWIEPKSSLVSGNKTETSSQSLSAYIYEKVVSLTSLNPVLIAGGLVTALTTAGYFLFPALSNKEIFKGVSPFKRFFGLLNRKSSPSFTGGGPAGGGSGAMALGLELARRARVSVQTHDGKVQTGEAETSTEVQSKDPESKTEGDLIATLEGVLAEETGDFENADDFIDMDLQLQLIYLFQPPHGNVFLPDQMDEQRLLALLNTARVEGELIFFPGEIGAEVELEELVRRFDEDSKIHNLRESIGLIRARLLELSKVQEGGGGGSKDSKEEVSLRNGDLALKDEPTELNHAPNSSATSNTLWEPASTNPESSSTADSSVVGGDTRGQGDSSDSDSESDDDQGVTVEGGRRGSLFNQFARLAGDPNTDPQTRENLNAMGLTARVRGRDGVRRDIPIGELFGTRVLGTENVQETHPPEGPYDTFDFRQMQKYSEELNSELNEPDL